MIRFVTMILVMALAGPLSAQSVKLKAHEIEALLSGNTAVGNWEGTAYRQFFDPDGSTIYAQEDVRSTLGQWRIDKERDEYQSLWPRDAEWEGWYVMEYAGDFFWVSKSTPPTPFKVVEGQQLVIGHGPPPQLEIQCRAILEWVSLARSGSEVATTDLVRHLSGGAMCGTSLAIDGKRSAYCAWPFAYRETRAGETFENLSGALGRCLDSQPLAVDNQTVNHPDSYDQRVFSSEQATVSLSLKDKGGLQETYIFLRFTPATR